MSSTREIIESIRRISERTNNNAILAKVVNVDGNFVDCEQLDGGANLLGVKLLAQDQTGFLIVPKLDSTVMVSFENEATGYVSMFSEVEEIQLNGENYEGLVRVADLTNKLNNLESDLNDLKQAFASWVVVPTDGGAALKAITSTWYGAPLSPTMQGEIENTTVKHGDGT